MGAPFLGLKDPPSCAMRIPNMRLVLKLDNGKMVFIADEQTHPVPYCNIDYDYSKKKNGDPIEKAYGRKSFDP